MRYLDPNLLNRVAHQQLEARFLMAGNLSGLHRSPYRGFSVEFTAHREYAPGDELRHLDWKVYGRTDRFFVKEHEAETNLKAYLFLDASGSMAYGDGQRKFDYGCHLATALTYLLLRQGDQVGLVLFDEGLRRHLPPSGRRTQLLSVADALEREAPSGKTGVVRALQETASDLSRPGLAVVISDLLEEPQAVMKALKLYRYKRFDVVVFHILHPDEVDFPFDGMIRFEDLELPRRVTADPQAVGEAYRQLVKDYIEEYQALCRREAIDYQLFRTDIPLETALVRYLASRE
jgi:uncharacterized protein (DUF58 family)